MIMKFIILLLLFVFVSSKEKKFSYKTLTKAANLWIPRSKFHSSNRKYEVLNNEIPSPEQKHQITFSMFQKNTDKIKELFLKISNPSDPMYGQYMTRDEITNIVKNNEAVETFRSFCLLNNITIIEESIGSEYIVTEATINTWENIFHTSFSTFLVSNNLGSTSYKDQNSFKIFRAESISLPNEINSSIFHVYGATDLPPEVHESIKYKKIDKKSSYKFSLSSENVKDIQENIYIDPDSIKTFYNIKNSDCERLASQGIYSSIDQKLSLSDLKIFQDKYNLPYDSMDYIYGGNVADDACKDDLNNCSEANLDVQYITAVGQNAINTHYYWNAKNNNNDYWTSFLVKISSMENLPNVYSFSYGSYEASFQKSYISNYNLEAQKLALLGTSLIVATGDDGVWGFAYSTYTENYYAMFPASSPYVTAVGATKWNFKDITQQEGDITSLYEEVVCQNDVYCSITTGGGFSTKNNRLSYQDEEVLAYFSKLGTTIQSPYGFTTSTGRGYPDVSLVGSNYLVVMNKDFYIVSGTSASAPAFAGMVSLANSARKKNNLPPLGFLNPFLYTSSRETSTNFFNDITMGNNRNTSNPSYTTKYGFYAGPGWDPVTGLGSVNVEKFVQIALTVGPYYPSASPSSSPTFLPTVSPIPTSVPTTGVPSFAPTFTPTSTPTTGVPSFAPTFTPTSTPTTGVPSYSPSFAPTAKPSYAPSLAPTLAPSYYKLLVNFRNVDISFFENENDLDEILNEVSSIVCNKISYPARFCASYINQNHSNRRRLQEITPLFTVFINKPSNVQLETFTSTIENESFSSSISDDIHTSLVNNYPSYFSGSTNSDPVVILFQENSNSSNKETFEFVPYGIIIIIGAFAIIAILATAISLSCCKKNKKKVKQYLDENDVNELNVHDHPEMDLTV